MDHGNAPRELLNILNAIAQEMHVLLLLLRREAFFPSLLERIPHESELLLGLDHHASLAANDVDHLRDRVLLLRPSALCNGLLDGWHLVQQAAQCHQSACPADTCTAVDQNGLRQVRTELDMPSIDLLYELEEAVRI